MHRREKDIKALIADAEQTLADVEAAYASSLAESEVRPELKVKIKHFCEDLRSALDYLAHDVRDSHCPLARAGQRFYFPIIDDASSFTRIMDDWYPGLQAAKPELWQYLESVQPFKSGKNSWLAQFNRLNNENKHVALVPQTRTETDRVTVKTQGGGVVSWNPANVRFGSGVRIGGVPVNPATQMPVPHSSQSVERVKWVDFRFQELNVSAIALLRQSLTGVREIASNIAKRM
jgi:hypothetical protein